MNTEQSNPLLCDIESGICEMPGNNADTAATTAATAHNVLKIIYFTDPICSSCWGIEPQLRKLKMEYGRYFDIEYRMGGLLPDWSYNSGGISKPSDVAHHWDEVSHYYDMPIDGDVWLEDPLHSSYPPSIAFKAAQMQDAAKAVRFLREIREMVFLRKQNITQWKHLATAAGNVGLDLQQFEADYHGHAKSLFKEDLDLGAQLGVRGFPTLFFADRNGGLEKVYGTKPYEVYEAALRRQLPSAVKSPIDTGWQKLFTRYRTLTTREFAELSQTPREDSEAFLQKLVESGSLSRLITKNGTLWIN
ncbi:UPF0413 Protein [Dyadobacter beijingensis]|uniref:UPF0413 Protein n=1 Tax=Dyadobacter beijingensis TaxID=365489 RepID=A0ABQ2I1H9_9BACT|nr:ClpXP adapter SpxH family protein [Dyadobacter beijingensis]GGM96187.1 UPF0413 Protein [Dyadobacter beijingensis]